ncbi:MAG: ROK family protein [Terriglobia bacterium]
MKRFAVGVDLGGTNLRIAAVDDAGTILERVSLLTRAKQPRESVIREMCQAIQSLTAKLGGAGRLAGIGVGVPGIIYTETGMLRQSPNLPGWEKFPVRQEIESLLGTRVWLDNDANVAALGELWLGAGRGTSSLCMLTLGTGVGGGLVFDGKIWHGFLGFAGELGHIVVAENGVRCPCGGQGCLETESSANAIVRKARAVLAAGRSLGLAKATESGTALTSELVFQIAQGGDAECRAIFESVGRYLGIALASLVNALNLPLYVIGGGAAGAWDLFAPAMFEELRRRSYVFCEGSTRIEKSVLQGDAGLYGAARLVFQANAA